MTPKTWLRKTSGRKIIKKLVNFYLWLFRPDEWITQKTEDIISSHASEMLKIINRKQSLWIK